MKKILRKRNGKLTPVYKWAVDYSKKKAAQRKALRKALVLADQFIAENEALMEDLHDDQG